MIYSGKELAYMCMKELKNIYAYAAPSKGNLVKNMDGNFDMDDAKNAMFLQKNKRRELDGEMLDDKLDRIKPERVAKRKAEKEKYVKKTLQASKRKNKKLEKGEEKVVVESPGDKEMEDKSVLRQMNAFEKRRQELQISKLEKENKLKEFEIETKMGDFVPLKDVVNALNFKTSELNKIFLSETEKYIQKICKREEIDVSDAIHYKKGVVELLNKIIKMAETKTLTQL